MKSWHQLHQRCIFVAGAARLYTVHDLRDTAGPPEAVRLAFVRGPSVSRVLPPRPVNSGGALRWITDFFSYWNREGKERVETSI